jgi:hypothetical protein
MGPLPLRRISPWFTCRPECTRASAGIPLHHIAAYLLQCQFSAVLGHFRTETYSPAAMDIAPAASPAMPANNTLV